MSADLIQHIRDNIGNGNVCYLRITKASEALLNKLDRLKKVEFNSYRRGASRVLQGDASHRIISRALRHNTAAPMTCLKFLRNSRMVRPRNASRLLQT